MIASRSARTNIAVALAAKLASIAVAVLSVPLLLNLMGNEGYGAWVTLTSLIAFISLLDLGVGNSIRNSVASMTSESENSVHVEFVCFFQMLCVVGFLMILATWIVFPQWHIAKEYRAAAWLLYLPLLLLLPLMLGSNVLQGARATGLQAALQAAGGWGFFAFVCVLAWSSYSPTISQLAIAWSVCYVIALLIAFVLALRALRLPARRLLKVSILALPKGRLRVGLEFLVLQLSSLVLYSLGNMLVFHHLGVAEVARYDVLNKIFQVGLSLYTIVIGVMWVEIARFRASSDASALGRILRRLTSIAVLFSIACIAGAFATPFVIDHWTQHRIQVSLVEALSVAVLASIQSLAYVGAVFMNAFEQIRVQILLAVVSILLMLPLSSALIAQNMGIKAVPLAASMLTLLPMVVCNLYAVRLVRGIRQPNSCRT